MEKLTSHQIRQRFLDYFQQHDHRVVVSYPLVPGNDPTLLFTNAGMVQFKDMFSGEEEAPSPRATSCQKCLRAGGKHNDLDQVGYTARHHTFFEMLGNFSFGDYFKEDAIRHAWAFLTEELKLDKERLYVTVFEGTKDVPADEEAYQIWANDVGVPKERILRLGMKDNFWSMGDTGPCGPCTEILYDKGPEASAPGEADGGPEEDGDRYVEVWNLVFMQFLRNEQGEMSPLPAPCVDTGMGLERITAVLQEKLTNYETDSFRYLLDAAAAGVGKKYGENDEDDVAMRVIADHARATAFLIADGVYPGKNDRNYVLRRIMRRAIRMGRKLGYDQPFFHDMCAEVVKDMGSVYPELKAGASIIQDLVQKEEFQFRRTLDNGLRLLEKQLEALQADKKKQLDGASIFDLYSTYGFPYDLVEIIAQEHGVSLDRKGFERAMKEEQDRGRDSWKKRVAANPEQYQALVADVGETSFVGYNNEESESTITALLVDGERVERVETGQDVEITVAETPFYAESGGQVGDVGAFRTAEGLLIKISDTLKPVSGLFVHYGHVEAGEAKVGEKLRLIVDHTQRSQTRRNHSATHLLHWALRKHLGDHVKQAGSLVSPERLRFDYSHYKSTTPEELQAIENDANRLIRENHAATTEEVSFDEAQAAGAMALFGEKYGEKVRMVRIGPSLELCGGTHVTRSGDIGQVRIIADQNIADGTRRIEALTGIGADAQFHFLNNTVKQASGLLRCRPADLPDRVQKLQQQLKSLQREVEQLKVKAAQAGSGGDLLDKAQQAGDITYLATRVDVGEPKAMREIADQLRGRIKSGVIVLAGENKGKASLCAMVTPDLKGKVHAGQLIKALAEQLDGRGGGKPDMAQGGGPAIDKLPQALSSVGQLLEAQSKG